VIEAMTSSSNPSLMTRIVFDELGRIAQRCVAQTSYLGSGVRREFLSAPPDGACQRNDRNRRGDELEGVPPIEPIRQERYGYGRQKKVAIIES
jgi:hypothetical protein